MSSYFNIIILFLIISFSENQYYCPDECSECYKEYGTYSDGEEYENIFCTSCIEGYFLKNSYCIKKCVENESGCKLCDVGENSNLCFQCIDEYELNYNKLGCHATYIYCGSKKFYHCSRCDNYYSHSQSTKCGLCDSHYKLVNNETCEYDFNYKDGKFIKFNIFIIIINIILFF